MKNPQESEYRVTVEADSLSVVDRNAQIQSYTQMLTAVGQAMQQITPMVEKVPQAAPAMFGIIKSFVAKFQASEELEGMFDQAINALQQAAAQPQQPDPVKQAEVQEKLAGAVDRKAAAVQKLADAELKTTQAMGTFPAPVDPILAGQVNPMEPQPQPTPQATFALQGQQQPQPPQGMMPQ